MISGEMMTLLTILRHRALVVQYLRKLAYHLESRALDHDSSKLSTEQFTGFVEINRIAREHKYGSSEYKAAISTDVVARHFALNSHHPEHYENGIDDMSLTDIIEMATDWKAASMTYGKATMEEVLPLQAERFGLGEKHLYLIKLIYRDLCT